MKGVIPMVLSLAFFGLAQGPTYLWAPCQIPLEAFSALPERAQTLSIPIARFLPEKGAPEFLGATDETELLSRNAFLYLDGNFFLLGVREGPWTTILRGKPDSAELIIFGPGTPQSLPGFAILEALGLLPAGAALELSEKTVPLKLPAPPEEVKLDPILWTLVGHPDWFSFARDYGLERVGLRVRAVAELQGTLSQAFAGYIRSSTDTLAELLIPIPLLPELGKDPAVRLVRPPFVPHPLGG